MTTLHSSAYLKDIESGQPAPVYLITGEEYLVRKTAEEITSKLLPKASPGLNLCIHDSSSPAQVARDLATIPLLRGRKVVVLREPEFLAPKKGRTDALAKIKDAWNSGRRRVAAQRTLAFFARAGWGVNELLQPDASAIASELELELAEADLLFLRQVGAFCQQENLTSPEGDTGALEKLLQKGLPENHYLIIEAPQFDARSSFAKLCAKTGVVVDRKVEKELRKLDIRQISAQVLAPFKKRLDAGAEKLLKDMCGGNMRLLQNELEKLAIFVGEKPIISVAEVELLVRRVREEEFRELADALGNRNLKNALRYVQGALSQDEPPLKIHGAIASIMRKMLEDRERWGKLGFTPRTSQKELEAKGMKFLAEEIAQQGTKRGAKMPHPYVVWLGFQACMRFELFELIRIMLAIAQADLSLKSGQNPRLILESLVLQICRQA